MLIEVLVSSIRRGAVVSVMRSMSLLAIGMTPLLVVSPALASAQGLSVSVLPNHTAVGKRTCFDFRIIGHDRKPVPGADVVLEGKRDKSNRRGRARICTRLEWSGHHFALVFKRHDHVGRAMITAHSQGLQSGDWIYVQYYLAAYGSDGHCSDYNFGEGQWGCDGHINATNDYYKDTPGAVFWRQQNGSIFFQLYTRITQDAHYAFSNLEGYVPSPSSDQFYIQQAYIDVDQGFRGHGDCPADATYGCLVSGTDPTKTGQPGGPLHLDVEYHHPFLQPAGYSFEIRGYVRSRCPC
jgi:hypothetical protein